MAFILLLSNAKSSQVLGQCPHSSGFLDYKAWDGSNWRMKLDGNTFFISPHSDLSKEDRVQEVKYKTWDGSD